MTKMRLATCVVVAGWLWMAAAGVSSAQNTPAPPAPPAVAVDPAPPAAPAPPSVDVSAWFDSELNFDFDADAFKLNMEDFKANMDTFKEDMKEYGKSLKDSLKGFKVDVNPFPGGLALQVPNPKAVPPPPTPPDVTPPTPPNFKFTFSGPVFNSLSDNLYNSAHDLINSGRYDRAIDQLDKLLRQFDGKGDAIANRIDAALYWKAYAQLKESTLSEALATLADLQKRFAESRWLKDAKALEVEVRQASGQSVSPEGQSDEELKLLALRGLMQADPDRALPMIEQLMSGNSSVRVKENALFVLSQSRTTRGREIIASVARSNSNPDVQLKAVRYLGTMRTLESRQALDDIYRSTSDSAVKRAIIQSWVSSDAVDKLSEVLKNEKEVQLRRTAIRSLGGMRRANTGASAAEALRAAYLSDSNVELRKDIVSALSSQQNAAILVDLAKAEKNPEMKREIVQRLSTIKAKEATDYLLELLK